MKIAIVGAGICGLYLGWKLSEKGFEVTIFEKNRKIGKQTCSGLFSQRVLNFIPESKRLIQNRIESALLHFPQKTLKIKFSRKFLVMQHDKLDKLVATFAQRAGARIILQHPINSIPEGFDKIIACDGALSKLRRILILENPQMRLGIQGFIEKKDCSNFVETWPTKDGFLWKIPRGKKIEYGIIEKTDRAKDLFENFLKEKKLKVKEINSALIPQGFVASFNPKIALCGDAAGLTKPWSGGGVIWGLVAADILLKNFPDFLKYNKEAKKFFLPKIIFSKMITKLGYFLGFNTPWLLPQNFKVESDFLL